MLVLIQRASSASVTVDGETIGAIGPGLLALVGIEPGDGQAQVEKMARRLVGYRIFGDGQGRMNLSLADTGGGLLMVSQFTLAADCSGGNRPSFTAAAPAAQGQALFDYSVQRARALHAQVATGIFGADMQVALVNDGPVTIWLEMH